MDVEVVGTDVVGIGAQDGFRLRDDGFGVFGGLAVERPQLPRRQVHHALGVHGDGIGVVGILLGELAHSVAVGRGKLVVIGFGVVGKAGCQGGGVRALIGGSVGRERDGFLDRVVCSLLALGIDVEVVVGAERQRDAHHGMGDLGSNSAARRKERSASPWLKP